MENVTVHKTDKFQHVVADEGYYLTSYKEDGDITYFDATKEAYFPLGYDFSEFWRVIPQADFDALSLRRDMEIVSESLPQQ